MATLTNTAIDQTYPGLIKTTDNAAIGAVEKEITDGLGNTSTLKMGTASASFVGTLDLTGATVTGLPPGGVSSIIAGTGISVDTATGDVTVTNTVEAGLINGVGADSLISNPSLTTNAPSAAGTNDICIGNGGIADGNNSIYIGANGQASTASVGIGNGVVAINTSIALHDSARATGERCVSIGRATDVSTDYSIGIGGEGTTITGAATIGIGSFVTASGANSVTLGDSSSSTASYSTALGSGVTAAMANTVSLKELEVQTIGGGITMYSPDGTAYKLTVANGGTLVIT